MVVNLGLVKAIFVGTAAPSNTNVIWRDTTVNKLKWYDPTFSSWVLLTSGGGGGGTFSSDIVVSLSGGKTLGKYTNGQTIPSNGLTAEQVMRLIAIEYILPVFTSFSISGQATTVEVGATLSTPATFIWGITVNSGTITTIAAA
jgi:hypothetical protein